MDKRNAAFSNTTFLLKYSPPTNLSHFLSGEKTVFQDSSFDIFVRLYEFEHYLTISIMRTTQFSLRSNRLLSCSNYDWL